MARRTTAAMSHDRLGINGAQALPGRLDASADGARLPITQPLIVRHGRLASSRSVLGSWIPAPGQTRWLRIDEARAAHADH